MTQTNLEIAGSARFFSSLLVRQMPGNPTYQDLLPAAWVLHGPPVIVGESGRHNSGFQNEPRTLPI
jgi:hypothetical protein